MSIISQWLPKAAPSFFSCTAEIKNNLHIELVDPRDWKEIAQKAKKWTWKAAEKGAKLPPNSPARAQLKDCAFICKTIESHISHTDPANRGSKETIQNCRIGPKELYVCKDEEGKVHGIAMAEKNRSSLVGNLLVTHPRNIPAGLKDPRSVKGVGTAFLNYADKVGAERGLKSLLLVNSDSSGKFYQKKGFSKINVGGFTMHRSIKSKL